MPHLKCIMSQKPLICVTVQPLLFTSLNCSLEYRRVFFVLSVIKHFISLNRWENARGDLTHERLHRHLVMRSSNKSTLIIQNPEQ